MVQYLELVLKRDLASGWRQTLGKLRLFFDSAPTVNSNDKADGSGGDEETEEMDWKQRFGKNWYY
jgi:hypothetical protein